MSNIFGRHAERMKAKADAETAAKTTKQLNRVLGVKPAPSDAVKIHSLKQLNRLLSPDAKGWTLVRAREGYYYFVHPEHAPSEGVYVFSCRNTTLGFWREELQDKCLAEIEIKPHRSND